MQNNSKNAQNFPQKKLQKMLFFLTLPLSIALMLTLSVDVLRGTPFTDDALYMHLQLAVCAVFMADFCLGLAAADSRSRYFWRNLFLLLISIPYSNLVEYFDIARTPPARDLLQLIPLLRASIAVAIVVGYISKNRLVSIFTSYMTILALVIYFSSILFYIRESPVNPNVTSYWTSLWWCCLESTTIGAPFSATTTIGRILACLLSLLGIIMFPLLTVYLSHLVDKWRTSPCV
jgi:hypothetical protein